MRLPSRGIRTEEVILMPDLVYVLVAALLILLILAVVGVI